MIIDCAHYRDGRRQEEGPVSLEDAAARTTQGGFVWLGLFEPEPEELDQVRAAFNLHELAVEDARTEHLRPKVELYGDEVRLVILRTARYDDAREEVDFGFISVFLAPTFVITVRHGVASELREARLRLEQRPELLTAGSVSALWAILDQVVDGYAPVVAGLEHDIDQIEATVFSGSVAPTERIYSLRREATDFFRAVHPLLGVVGSIERTVAAELQPYLRDVRDHVLLVDEEVAAQRDLLGTVLEANMAVISAEQARVSVQQNATIEQLTILATVFLPLTFVTGFFGQNFGWLVGNIDTPVAFVIYGIGGLAIPLVLLYSWLKRSRPRRPEPSSSSRASRQPSSQVSTALANSAGSAACTRCPAGIVTRSQRGIRAAASATLAWSMWLAGPPAISNAGAVDGRQSVPRGLIAGIHLRDDGGYHRPVEVQRAVGPVRDRPVPRERRRGVLHDEPADEVRTVHRHQVRDRTAHRVPDQRDPAEAEHVQSG